MAKEEKSMWQITQAIVDVLVKPIEIEQLIDEIHLTKNKNEDIMCAVNAKEIIGMYLALRKQEETINLMLKEKEFNE